MKVAPSAWIPRLSRIMRRDLPSAVVLALLTGFAGAAEPRFRMPDTMYAQVGAGRNVTSATIGVTWDMLWSHESRWGLWEGYLELSLGRWRLSRGSPMSRSQTATLVGFMPGIRLRPKGWNRFFVEAGIGANWIFPIYRNDTRQFSTTFNFGDHIAVGRQFGRAGEQELMLRLQHFSNAGIKHPNPGENFVQLRYARRF